MIGRTGSVITDTRTYTANGDRRTLVSLLISEAVVVQIPRWVKFQLPYLARWT
jgi:hypothetical protein